MGGFRSTRGPVFAGGAACSADCAKARGNGPDVPTVDARSPVAPTRKNCRRENLPVVFPIVSSLMDRLVALGRLTVSPDRRSHRGMTQTAIPPIDMVKVAEVLPAEPRRAHGCSPWGMECWCGEHYAATHRLSTQSLTPPGGTG